MANTYVEYSESDDEEKRLNLLDVIDEKNRAANKVLISSSYSDVFKNACIDNF